MDSTAQTTHANHPEAGEPPSPTASAAAAAAEVADGPAGGSAIEVAGTWNARDVGTGRHLRTGVLLRSASLSAVEPAGLDALDALGVSVVLDLRGDDEVVRDGADVLPPGVRQVRLPFGALDRAGGHEQVGGSQADPLELVSRLVGSADPDAAGEALMRRLYAGFASDPAAHAAVARALEELAHEPGAVLVHCTAGKDRTGWVVAVVQMLCGVAWDDVLEEYLRSAASATTLAAALPSLPGVDPAFWSAVTTVRPVYLETAVQAVEDTYGSLEGYIRAIGAEPDIVTAVRTRLVVAGTSGG